MPAARTAPARRISGALALAASLACMASLFAAYGCDTTLPGDEVCRDVGYSISAKVFECSGDVDRANKAYEDFMANRTCLVPAVGDDEPYAPGSTDYGCSRNILEFSCDKSDALGENYDQWLSDGNCGSFTGANGGVLPPANLADGGTDAAAASPGVFKLTATGAIDGQSLQFDCGRAPSYSQAGGELFNVECGSINAASRGFRLVFLDVQEGTFSGAAAAKLAAVVLTVGQSQIILPVAPDYPELTITVSSFVWNGPTQPMSFTGSFELHAVSPQVDFTGTFEAGELQPQ
jgi:hypothetical protein